MKTLESWLAEPSQEIGVSLPTICGSCGSYLDAGESCVICSSVLRMQTLLAERKGRGRFMVASLPPEKD